MDERVEKAILEKIGETVAGAGEVAKIRQRLVGKSGYGAGPATAFPGGPEDFAFGVAVGRIYNSFHYQTRRILKRDATEQEFSEFLELLAGRARDIRQALKDQQEKQRRQQRL